MLEELEKLISFIEQEYIEFNERWKASQLYSEVNLRKNEVYQIEEDKDILNRIFDYRKFLNENNINLIINVRRFNTENVTVNIRTKTKNSIEYKIKNYIKNHENGKVPINKCLNDLFGIRIICSENFTKNQIMNYIKEKNRNLKCIDSSKGEYKAIHVYFKKDNFSFPWELQIWNKCNEETNIISHEKYKQDYAKWEQENKGGKK